MAKERKNITQENIGEWLGSTGFIFPRNEVELLRFKKLYQDYKYELSMDDVIDPAKIIRGELIQVPNEMNEENSEIGENWRMAARNFKNIPDHILKKMKGNQDNGDSDS